MVNSSLDRVMPFFIVDDLGSSIDFYCDRLGFEVQLLVPDTNPFYAVVSRDNAAFCLKQISANVHPLPNCTRHEWARWDAFVSTKNPDAMYDELVSKNVEIYRPLDDTEDGIRAFEIKDNSGYVLCFGWPLDNST